MTQELARKRTTLSSELRSLVSNPPWHGLALAAILILSAFLNLFRLTSLGYGNDYYAAAVKDMLTSWHNFFFVSFDAGFVSVDKPPLGLWIQAASAYLFGFNGLSLLLPEAIAGVLSVALLYHLVRRVFGPVVGLLAALALALTPIIVATSRNNTMDMPVVLAVLFAAWAFIVATERGSLHWLLLGAVVMGLGFNIKTLQAFLVLPAFYLLYLLAARTTWRRRFVHLSLAMIVLLIVSLSWVVAVDLTPPEERPYVGGSNNDSALDLAFGYNGIERLLGRNGPLGSRPEGGGPGDGKAPQSDSQEGLQAGPGGGLPGPPPGGGPGGIGENGEPGPLRLLNQQNAGQIGWLLPLAVVGLLAAGSRRWPRLPLDRREGNLVLWGTWLFTAAAYFSVSGYGHRHYLVMLAPAIAALVGIGTTALWRDYRSPGWRGWLLPLVLVGMAAVQDYILWNYEGWPFWLASGISGLCLVAAGVLALVRLKPPFRIHAYALGATTVGVLALLIAPAAWTAYDTLSQGSGGPLPAAGPRPPDAEGGPGGPPPGGPGGGPPPPGGPPPSGPGGGPPPPGGGPGGPGGPGSNVDSALVDYLQTNKGNAEYLVATTDAHSASPIILNTDERVITLGGFIGRDPAVTPDELTSLINEGAVRFFLAQDRERMEELMAERESYDTSPQYGPPPGPPPGMNNEAVTWVQDNCEQVPQEEWQSPEAEEHGDPPGRAQALYDCGLGVR